MENNEEMKELLKLAVSLDGVRRKALIAVLDALVHGASIEEAHNAGAAVLIAAGRTPVPYSKDLYE